MGVSPKTVRRRISAGGLDLGAFRRVKAEAAQRWGRARAAGEATDAD
jgi:hypothetical protein